MKPIPIRGKPAAMPLVCAPLVGATREAVLAEAAAALAAKADIVEWRVDHFRNFQDVMETGRALRRIGLPILFTRRSPAEGGNAVPISEKQVVELYGEVCADGFADLVDYEMSNPAQDIKAVREVSRRHGVGLVCSFHDFERTPPLAELAARYRRAQELGGDVAKVSVMARAPEDALTLLAATQQASQALALPLIGVSMGPHGALSRMIGFAFGSALTFGVAAGRSAPGQMPIGELRAAIEIARKALG
ncbi:MAG TPA: type I 3-dehydroquinate dehydratase [Burkholderiales bacterium]|nr:type I 3-dehydroquinate dehydratase [Burkholderiales bacterium]